MSKFTLSIACDTLEEVQVHASKLIGVPVALSVGPIADQSAAVEPAEQPAPRPRGRPPKAKTEEPKNRMLEDESKPTPPPVAPEKPKPAAEKPKLKDTDVRAKLAEVAEKFSPNEARAIIKGFATNITELKAADYQAVYDAAVAKLGPAETTETAGDDEDFLK
jgi:hypothetical protein